MIVAAAQLTVRAQKRLARRADEILQFVLTHHGLHRRALLVLACRIVGAGDEKAGGLDCFNVVGPQRVAGQLLAAQIRRMADRDSGADDPIAIWPRIAPRLVIFKTVAFAKPGQVQPVAGPTLAVVGRGQQTVDLFLVGLADRYRRRTLRPRPAWGVGQSGRRPAGEATCDDRPRARARALRFPVWPARRYRGIAGQVASWTTGESGRTTGFSDHQS